MTETYYCKNCEFYEFNLLSAFPDYCDKHKIALRASYDKPCKDFKLKKGNTNPKAEIEKLTEINHALLEACKEMIRALNGTYLDDKMRAKERMQKAITKAEGKE